MLNDGILLKICDWLDINAVVNLERTSSKLRQFVSTYIGRLPKYRVDQASFFNYAIANHYVSFDY